MRLYTRVSLTNSGSRFALASRELTPTNSILIWLTKNVDEDSFYHIYVPAALALLAAAHVYLALAL
jgi:hypothetical protein